jgi:hypothetical protein
MVDTRNSHPHVYDTIKVVVRVEGHGYFQQKFIMSKTLIFT